MTRDEHLQWAKNRAMEYINRNDYPQAVASMLSDLGKHPDTEKSAQSCGFLALMVKDRRSAIDFVQGFN